MHPDVEFEATARPDARVWRGRDRLRRAITEWIATWEEYSFEVHDYLEALNGRVLVLWTERGRGKGSGIAIEHHGGYVVTLRDGEIVHMALYNEVSQARTAAGLPA